MKKELGKKLHNNRQTIEAYACNCSCNCSCSCNCNVNPSYSYNIYNSNRNSGLYSREESSVLSRIAWDISRFALKAVWKTLFFIIIAHKCAPPLLTENCDTSVNKLEFITFLLMFKTYYQASVWFMIISNTIWGLIVWKTIIFSWIDHFFWKNMRLQGHKCTS